MGIYRALPQAFVQGIPRYDEDTVWKINCDAKRQYWAVPLNSQGDIIASPFIFSEDIVKQFFVPACEEEQKKELLSSDDRELLLLWYKSSDRANIPQYSFPENIVETPKEEDYFSPDLAEIAQLFHSDYKEEEQISSNIFVENNDNEKREKHVFSVDSGILEQKFQEQFIILLERLKLEEREKIASEILALLNTPIPPSKQQAYIFSELGLTLRKEELYSLALLCHQKALELSPNDENILFNVGRAQFELNNIEQAKFFLEKAIQIAPDFQAAYKFLNFLSVK